MMSSFDFAKQILLGESLEDKLIQSPVTFEAYQEFSLPKAPGRKGRIQFSIDQMKFPKAHSLRDDQKKAMALHSFANHELLAIEMMAAALLIYPHESEEDVRFKKGILTALKDEQKHLSLYVNRINELGFEFGDFPLNDFFWRQMEKLKTPGQYSAVMALTFEAANLDFAQYYEKIFRDLGDEVTANILQVVLDDELTHVAFGAYWMKKWKNDKSLWAYYQESLPWPMTPARSRGLGFDPLLHKKAIGDDEFIESLINFDDDFKITKRS